MSILLSTEQTGHEYNGKWLFKDIYVGINKGARIGLVGANGTGKSTLLKILAGLVAPVQGKVVKERYLKIGYLEQDPDFKDQLTIADFVYALNDEQHQLIRQYEELLEKSEPDERLLNQLTDKLNELNAWENQHKIKTVLSRLGIHHFERKITSLSGGQRKRLALAKLLIDEPDLYILDEPTNHLDIETIEWLEDFLTKGQKTIILVTHDRYFLDNVCERIFELDQGKLYAHAGNYAYYLEKRAERLSDENTMLERNRNLLRRELEWMRRQPQARSTKSKARINAFYELEQKVDKQKTAVLELGISASRQGNKILELNHVSKSFNGEDVVQGFEYTFKKGDRIGIAGKNGSGKSTLLNLITGTIKPDKGTVIAGETVVFGYYKQTGIEPEENGLVIDAVKNIAEYITLADKKTLTASQLLTLFLFPPEKQYNRINKLSGGERKRLQLMQVLMKNPNFLILDEPTNDLDLDTLNVLEDFLQKFPGVLLLVSHDRYLVDRLTEQLFILEKGVPVKIFGGNYTDYRLEQEKSKTLEKTASANGLKSNSLSKKQKLSFKDQKELDVLDREIPDIEKKIKLLTEQLSSGNKNPENILDILKDIDTMNSALDEKTNRWIELSELSGN